MGPWEIYYEGFKEKLYAPHFSSMAFSRVVTSCKLGFMDTLSFDLEIEIKRRAIKNMSAIVEGCGFPRGLS